jgi:Uma2 family endonuclease
MALVKEAAPKYYTYTDFLEWDEDVRAELFDGELVMMATPLRAHQAASGELFFQIRTYLTGKKCKVYPAPFAVRLFPQKDKRDDTVFEPDIVVVCDQEKLDDKGCNGPPDMVVEIVSPSSAKYDRVLKFRKYQKAGVREYWIVDPEIKTVQVCVLENGRFVPSV